ncbi:hypothetical protein [Mesorhizobium australicum]|jgi:hypothetical protein|uniref:Uncharacterized protein n=1 Tax=Mesorhizobium australicum TaxID=536018 RepID=A0A1X7PHK1_9HYPH|nr:hypothetical protein [Mesorhizobium australicum]SMH50048.1 hypothetical protein SAMN02982922_4063 [Mesorhizobium australicum]
MKFLSTFFRGRRTGNLITSLERARLGRTMPGQTAALAANRLGGLLM